MFEPAAGCIFQPPHESQSFTASWSVTRAAYPVGDYDNVGLDPK